MPLPNWFGLFYWSSVATSRSKSAIFSSWLVTILLAGSVLVVVNTQQSVALARRINSQAAGALIQSLGIICCCCVTSVSYYSMLVGSPALGTVDVP